MKKIKVIEMVRKIRDKQYEETMGKSQKELMDYYRKKAGNIPDIQKFS